MFRWLKEKGQNARVHMCATVLKQKIQTASLSRRASILALSHLVRDRVLSEGALRILDKPQCFSRENQVALYESIESLVLQGREAEARRAVFGKENGIPPLKDVGDRIDDMHSAMELWMCTVGASFAPNNKVEVQEIWKLLLGSVHEVGAAIERQIEADKFSLRITGIQGISLGVDPKSWRELCIYVPAAFAC